MASTKAELAKTLLGLVGAVAADAPLEHRLTLLCEELRAQLGCDRSSVFLADGRAFRPTANAGNPTAMDAAFRASHFRLDDPLFSACLRDRAPIHVPDAAADPRVSDRVVEVAQVRSLIVAPIAAAGTTGVITAEFNETNDRFGDYAKEVVLGIAQLAGVAIELVRAHEREERRREAFRWQSEHDALTGLPNRRRLLAELEAWCSDEAGGKVAVLLADLDRFKVVNDGLGHEAGDAVLVEIAQRMARLATDGALVARLGGDEFVVAARVERQDEAVRIAGELEARLGPPVVVGGERRVRMTASVGIAVADVGVASPDALLRDADAAMYIAKKERRTRSVVATADHRTVLLHRFEIETELVQALESGQIVPWFQPMVDVSDGRVLGVEALARWDHPVRGMLSPAEFLPSIFEMGLSGDLTRQMVRQSSDALEAARVSDDVTLYLNVAADELGADLLDVVAEIRGARARPLVLELSESTAITLSGLGSALPELVDLGVGLAIDDFGTGYSSFTVLRDLPVDVVKIDASLLRGDPARSEEVLRSIAALCRALGRRVLAEGVEDDEHLDLVHRVGIELAQGFLLGRPQPLGVLAPRMLPLG